MSRSFYRQNPYGSWQERYLMIQIQGYFTNLKWGSILSNTDVNLKRSNYCTWGVDNDFWFRVGVSSFYNPKEWNQIIYSLRCFVSWIAILISFRDELVVLAKLISEQWREVLNVLCWMILHDGSFLQNDGFQDVNWFNLHLWAASTWKTSLEQGVPNNGGNTLEKSGTGRASSVGDWVKSRY